MSIIVWAVLFALCGLRLLVMCLDDREEPQPLGWLVPVASFWCLVMLVRAICLS